MDRSEVRIKRVVLDRMERCGVCHRAYGHDDIHVISRKPDMWMLLVECTDCHARNFVAAVMNDGDADQAQLALRRLSRGQRDAAEPLFLKETLAEPPPPEAAQITADDVLDMHEFLAEFDGDFAALFRHS